MIKIRFISPLFILFEILMSLITCLLLLMFWPIHFICSLIYNEIQFFKIQDIIRNLIPVSNNLIKLKKGN